MLTEQACNRQSAAYHNGSNSDTYTPNGYEHPSRGKRIPEPPGTETGEKKAVVTVLEQNPQEEGGERGRERGGGRGGRGIH